MPRLYEVQDLLRKWRSIGRNKAMRSKRIIKLVERIIKMKAYVDKRKCYSDNRLCKPITECPAQAIKWIEDEEEPLGSRIEIDLEKCTGCGICVSLCCGDCIELK